ncbi:MAG: BlaI/MecI/CopY family transcriptional regulator [Candidatus Neomarinimicrobiota bacterium]
MKQSRKELSVAEWEIMHAIWRVGRSVTVRQVLEAAYPRSEKAYTTVQTLMNILVEKGFLTRRKQGRINYYSAVRGREDVLRGSLIGVAQRMFQGSLGAMASFLVSSVKLRPEELQELKRILAEHTEESR